MFVDVGNRQSFAGALQDTNLEGTSVVNVFVWVLVPATKKSVAASVLSGIGPNIPLHPSIIYQS